LREQILSEEKLDYISIYSGNKANSLGPQFGKPGKNRAD
jgi:hypothetical protein